MQAGILSSTTAVSSPPLHVIDVELPPDILRSSTITSSLEAVRDQCFEQLFARLLIDFQGAIQALGQNDALEAIPMVDHSQPEQPESNSSMNDGLSSAAWGECSSLPARWLSALLAVLDPLLNFLDYKPSPVGHHAGRLRLLLQSSCKEMEQMCR